MSSSCRGLLWGGRDWALRPAGSVGPRRSGGQVAPGEALGAQGSNQFGTLLFNQPVAGGQGPQQGEQWKGLHLARQQGPGEGLALGLAMGGADAGMEAPMPGASTWHWWA